MADVFISYAREDRQWVEQLARQLQAEGFSVWWDWDLLVGKRYRETIDTERLERNIRASVEDELAHDGPNDGAELEAVT